MIYSYRNFPFGETVTGQRSAGTAGTRSNMEWVLNNKLGISYIGRAAGSGDAGKSQKNSSRVPKHVAQAV